jgi:hypothetical protein
MTRLRIDAENWLNRAGHSGNANRLAVPLDRVGAPRNGLVVKGGQAATHDVDDAVAAVDTEAVSTRDVLEGEDLRVAQSLART